MNNDEIAHRVIDEVEADGLRVVRVRDHDDRSENLVAVDFDGREVWRAKAQDVTGSKDDDWVELRVNDGRILAFTWSCVRIEFDPRTGQILDRAITR